jgi:hypothetical protein
MKTKIIRYALFFAIALLSSGVFNPGLEAAIPKLINYQGKLTDVNGNPLTGSYGITLRIYDAETAGNLLWQEAHTGVVVDKGVFSVLLGSVTNLSLAFDNPYFLEIKVGEEVMTPRQRMTSSGYAIRAEEAEKYNGAGKVGTKAVDEAGIDNGKILFYDSTSGKVKYKKQSGWVLAEKRTISSASALENFTGLSPGVRYRVLLNLKMAGSTAGNTRMKFNNSTGSSYVSIIDVAYTNNTHAIVSSPARGEILLSTGSVDTAYWYFGEVSFQSVPSDNLKVSVLGQSYYGQVGTADGRPGSGPYPPKSASARIGGEYRDTQLSSMQIAHNGSGFIGEIILEKYES